jgi:hypothetical protein
MENSASINKAGYIAKNSTADDLYARVKALYTDMSYVWGNCNGIEKWDTWSEICRNWDLIRELFPRVALCVEYCSEQIKAELKLICTSEEKKAAAIAYIDDLIRLGFVGEIVSDMAISYMVDAAVRMLNEKYGKEWGLTNTAAIAKVAKNVATASVSAPVERDGK